MTYLCKLNNKLNFVFFVYVLDIGIIFHDYESSHQLARKFIYETKKWNQVQEFVVPSDLPLSRNQLVDTNFARLYQNEIWYLACDILRVRYIYLAGPPISIFVLNLCTNFKSIHIK